MATDDLPKQFDIIVVGTGFTETIVAAAFSRIGLKVLHLDRNDYYGGAYANFNLEAIETWKRRNNSLSENAGMLPEPEVATDIKVLLNEGEVTVALPPESAQACNIKSNFHIRERTLEEEAIAEAKKSKSRFYWSPVNVTKDQELDPVESKADVKKESEDIGTTTLDNSAQTNVVDEVSEKVTEKDAHEDSSRDKQRDSNAGGDLVEISKLSELTLSESRSNDSDRKQVDPEQNKPVSGSDEKQAGAPSRAVGDSSFDQASETQAAGAGDTETQAAGAGDSETQAEGPVDAERQADAAGDSGSLESKEWTIGDLKDEWRRFCFDISPKVLYCCGEIIELLIQSDVARYCEFRTVSRVLTLLNDSLQQVPCSRADVFSSKIVSLVEKRLMMKFLQFAADYEKYPEDYHEYKGKPFVEFLKSKRLTANIQHFVQHAIAMVTDSATTEEGLKATQIFLRSLGRYGNTAFLYPLYGTGELPQAFARLSAVFGGVYCLQVSPTHIVADGDNNCCGIITSNNQLIRCKYIIAEVSYLPSSFVWTFSNRKTSRAIFITDKSVLPSAESELSLLNFVSKDDISRPVVFLELPSSASVCPQNLFVVHLTRTATNGDAEKDFMEIRETLFSSETTDVNKPKLLWSIYFTLEDRSQLTTSDSAVKNVLVASGGGDAGVDLDFCIQEAKCIFNTVCPDEEFLPKPPNPEDIIHVDDTEAAVATGPSEFEGKDNEDRVKDNEKEVVTKDVAVEDSAVVGEQDTAGKINLETGEASAVVSSDD
ncbi:hypothetical protein BsWGS_17565 [Bradybaena similaris]